MADEQKQDAENQEEKKKKIKSMTLQELEAAIEKTKKNMGGLNSRYAKELLKRKESFTNK